MFSDVVMELAKRRDLRVLIHEDEGRERALTQDAEAWPTAT